jgi:hypothetical protein
MRTLNPQDELRRLFRGLVEQVFMADVGICSPALTDYLGRLLTDFVHMDRIYRLRTVDGRVIREVSRLQAEADLGPVAGEAAWERLINRYIGDFSLFWTGVYPELLRPRRRHGVDRVREYVLQGKRGYGVAGELSSEGDVPPAELLFDLSEQFESCAHGLHLVRESWQRLSQRPGHN